MFNESFVLMGGPQAGGSGSSVFLLVYLGLIFVLMYMLLIRPQRKKQKEHAKMVSELKKGDKVITSAGMIGTIFAIDDENARVILKFGEEIKMEFLKSAIAAKVEK